MSVNFSPATEFRFIRPEWVSGQRFEVVFPEQLRRLPRCEGFGDVFVKALTIRECAERAPGLRRASGRATAARCGTARVRVMNALGARLPGCQNPAHCVHAGAIFAHPVTEPLISVVVLCYDARTWIEAALRAVQARDVGLLQVPLTDDRPQDSTVAFVAQSFPSVRVLQQADVGVAAARNCGLEAAQGHWVAVLDTDDIWLPGNLAAPLGLLQAAPAARRRPNLCRLALVGELSSRARPPVVDERAHAQSRPQRRPYPDQLLECGVWTGTVPAERALLREFGGSDESMAVREGYDPWRRACRLTPVLRVTQP